MLTRSYFGYLLASRRKGTLYVGVTAGLKRRVWEHRQGLVEGFTRKYGVKMMVWYEQTESIESAIVREKQIKKWNRDWKSQRIEGTNPQWRDIYDKLAA